MGHVFISYSSKDSRLAEEVCRYLEKKQIICWMAPRNIESGCDYMESIPKAIAQCDYFLLVMTHNVQNSKWVQNEVGEAISKGKDVIPFVTEEFEISDKFAFLLRCTHWEYGIENWLVALERIAETIGNAQPEPSGSRSEELDAEKERLPQIKKPECPLCGSTRLAEDDQLQDVSMIVRGLTILDKKATDLCIVVALLTLLTIIAYEIPAISDYVVCTLSVIPYLGDFLLAGKGIGVRLYTIIGIAAAVLFALGGMLSLCNRCQTSKYRKMVEANRHQVEYTCKECGYKFMKTYTPDEARIRIEQNTDDNSAWIVALWMISVAVVLIWVVIVARKTVLQIVLVLAIISAFAFLLIPLTSIVIYYVTYRKELKKTQNKQSARKAAKKEAVQTFRSGIMEVFGKSSK